MSATGTFALSFSVNGPTWPEAFGLKYLSIKGFEMKAGINIVALAPTFSKFLGEVPSSSICLGKSRINNPGIFSSHTPYSLMIVMTA